MTRKSTGLRVIIWAATCLAGANALAQGREAGPIHMREIDVLADPGRGYGGGNPRGERGGPEGPRGDGTAGGGRAGGATRSPTAPEVARARATGQGAVPVTIGGTTYMVSPQARVDVKEFLQLYNQGGQIGQIVAAAGALFSLFGLVTEPTPYIRLTFDADEVVTVLSAPSIFAAAWRAQALRYVREYINPTRAHTQEGRMWQRLEDIIRDPARYRDGGMRLTPERKLMLRALPGERYRSIAGDHALTRYDQQEMGKLVDSLRGNPVVMDYVVKSDVVLGIFTPGPSGPTLSARDQYLLNMGLLRLPVAAKQRLAQAFWLNANDQNANPNFWRSLADYLTREEWARNSEIRLVGAIAGYTDDLGFTDDLRRYDDGFWAHTAPAALATTGGLFQFRLPPQNGPQVWTFDYPGPRAR